MVLNGLEKRLHFRCLVHHVMGEEEAAGVEPRIHDVEESFVVRLPRVEEHEIEGALKLWNLLERVAMYDAHDIGQSGFLDVRGRFLGALRIVLNGDDVAAGLASAEAEPDAAVAAGRANLEHRLRTTGGDEHAQESAVFFRDRKLSFIDGLDALQDGFKLRRQRTRRTLLCRGGSDE